MQMHIFNNPNDASDFVRKNGDNRYYCYILTDSGSPFYVGVSKVHKRPMNHLTSSLNNAGENLIKEARIRKISEDGRVFGVSIIGFFYNQMEVYHAEKSLILLYGKICNKTGCLTNILDGGDGSVGRPASEEQKDAVRKYMTGRPKTTETRKRLSESISKFYENNPGTFTGRKHTDETRAKQSLNMVGENNPQFGKRGDLSCHYGKKRSDDVRDAIKHSLAKIDTSCTEDRKQKLREYWASQPVLTCPHCGKQSSFKPSMVRAHFDNCKSLKQE